MHRTSLLLTPKLSKNFRNSIEQPWLDPLHLLHYFSFLLQNSINSQDVLTGKTIHAHFVVNGIRMNHPFQTKLVILYARFGSITYATHVFKDISSASAHSLNAMIHRLIQNRSLRDARQLFDEMRQWRNVVSWNSMIAAYGRNGQIQCAQQLFDEMPERDVVSWNSMLAGYHRLGDRDRVMGFYIEMERDGIRPTGSTMGTVISSISDADSMALIRQIHARTICLGLDSNVFVGTSLIRACFNSGDAIGAKKVFDKILWKNIASWNAMVSGYMDVGCISDACLVFEEMPDKNIISWTTMVNGYVCNNKLDDARCLFDKMPKKNVISWTVMISGYEQNGCYKDALEVYFLMHDSQVWPNQSTFSSVLSACAGCSSLIIGKLVHVMILKSNLQMDVILSSSLVDMYAKCGQINAAICVFDAMPKKNLVSWNSIIGGYARQGLGVEAVLRFERMKEDGIGPDYVTFTNVLAACGHGGLVEEGEKYFSSMELEFGVRPKMEHYACMVDLLGRAGQLEKAEQLIKKMPFEPDVVIWGALLGACCVYSNLELGSFAAEHIFKLKQDHPMIYSMLCKIHGNCGMWDRVAELRGMMKEIGAKKQKGISWIENPAI